MIHLSLNLQSRWLPEWLLANSLPHRAKRLYPFAVSGEGGRGVPGTTPFPSPLLLKDDNDKRGGGGWGVKILFRFTACGARAIQYVPENPKWRQAEGALYQHASPGYLTVTESYLWLMCTTFLRLFWGGLQKWRLVQSEDMTLYSTLSSLSFSFLLTFPLSLPVGTQQAGPWPYQLVRPVQLQRPVWQLIQSRLTAWALTEWILLVSITLVLK